MHATNARAARRGYSLIELLVVAVVVGIMLTIFGARFRISPETEVQLAATQLAQDLDLARTRALSTRSLARVRFSTGSGNYTGYLDDDNDGAIVQTQSERDALRAFGTRALPLHVAFGRGDASDVPDVVGAGPITFADETVEFDARGLTLPAGVGGVVYLRQESSTTAVAAVAISPAGNVRLWTWQLGAWK